MAETKKTKVFCIGLGKTGTTSIGDALAILGYRRSGWHDIISRQLTHDWWCGNLDSLFEHTTKYDAFEDNPWPLVYQEMAARYPTAKFILTTRSDHNKWLRSISEHNMHRPWVGHRMIYGSYEAIGNEERYLRVYHRHRDSVRAFFADKPDRLLELCIDETRDWNALCKYLDISEVPTVPFPKSNVTASHMGLLQIGRQIWGILHYTELAFLYFLYKESWMVAMDPIYEQKDHVAEVPSLRGRIEQTSDSLSQRCLRAYLDHR